GDPARTDVRERHADELRLTAVVATARVRVAVDPSDGARVRIDVVAVGVEPARAEEARPTVDVERDHHAVAALEVLDGGADLGHLADELVAERMPDASVGHHAVEEVKVRSADGSKL